MKKYSLIILGFAALFLVVGFFRVRATDYTSTNFVLRDPVLGIFGGLATSTSFEETRTGGEIATGISTSTSFELRGGFQYFNGFTGQTQNWRWYDDEDAIVPTSSLAAENTAPSNVYNENELKLRIAVKELAGIAGENVKFRLQFSSSSDFSTGAADVIATSSCGSTSTRSLTRL
mgnify:CR=1 FL=1